MDLFGFGKTPHPDYPLGVGDYAQGVREIMEKEKMDSAVLIGHSFGGRVALRLAAESSLVSALVLIDSAGVPPRRGIRYYSKVWLYKVKKALGLRVRGAGSSDYNRLSGAMKGTFVRVVNESNLPDCDKIKEPVLLFWGREDKDTPLYMCKKLRRRLKNSEAVVIKGAGHFSYLERPEYAFRVVRAFCKTI